MSNTNQFTSTPILNIPSNTFDLSHDVKLTCDQGYIVPVSCIEAIPGDRFNYSNKTFVRLAPMVAPVMHKMDVTTITGFVPYRLIWENFQKFMAEPVPTERTPVPPHFSDVAIKVGSLGDYLGLPTDQVYDEQTGGVRKQYNTLEWVSAAPYAAYQKFFNDWFRDENLYNNGEEVDYMLNDGVNSFAKFDVLRKRAWRHDYFTSSLPFAQKGEAVEIPIANFADVRVSVNPSHALSDAPQFVTQDGSYVDSGLGPMNLYTPSVGNFNTGTPRKGGVGSNLLYDPKNTLVAETSRLSNAAAVTVNTLRWAEKLQVFLEKNARGGTRYTEIVRQHFGVRSSDARLQRAEFLGFSVNPVTISEVLQTSETQDQTPLGEMAGHGISYGGAKHVNYFAEEHGFFVTFLNIRPRTAYMQGISRMWSRKSPLDYAWPTFAQLGEQEVKNQELYVEDYKNPNLNEETFGYLPRYSDYRYQSDRVAGEMRTSYAHWHLARIFPELPKLSEDFISCTPSKRIFAINTAGSNPFILHINHAISVRRPLPKYGIPAL